MVRPPGFEPGITGLEGLHQICLCPTRLDYNRTANQQQTNAVKLFYELSLYQISFQHI